MKSLEEVIEYKYRFMSENIDPLYFVETIDINNRTLGDFILYISNGYFHNVDNITFLEEIKPLLVYFSSCLRYNYNFNRSWFVKNLQFKIYVPYRHSKKLCNLEKYFIYSNYTSSVLRETNEPRIEYGYNTYWNKPVKLRALISIQSPHRERRKEEEILPPPINNFKTFKVEQCVICLDNIPNVLFCNCGHICICETCNVNEFDNCPMREKENTILRIIE